MTNIITNLVSSPTGQEAKHAEEWLKLVIGALPVAGFALGYWTYWLTARRDKASRVAKGKDEFMAVVADQRAKLVTESRREVFYAESVPVFVGAVYRLRYVLPDRQWQRLRAVLSDYESQGYKQFDRFQDLQAAFFKDRESSKQRLVGFLERFERSLDDNAA